MTFFYLLFPPRPLMFIRFPCVKLFLYEQTLLKMVAVSTETVRYIYIFRLQEWVSFSPLAQSTFSRAPLTLHQSSSFPPWTTTGNNNSLRTYLPLSPRQHRSRPGTARRFTFFFFCRRMHTNTPECTPARRRLHADYLLSSGNVRGLRTNS